MLSPLALNTAALLRFGDFFAAGAVDWTAVGFFKELSRDGALAAGVGAGACACALGVAGGIAAVS